MRTIIIIIVLAALGYFGFNYATRPVAQPTEDISTTTQSDQLPTTTQSTEEHYRIASAESKTQFAIKETLNGKPFTAVGTTNQIAGDIVIKDADTKPQITVGVVKVDARMFKTDSEKRDGAINRFILETETAGNEYIVFTPTDVTNPTAPIVVGTPFTFSVTGTLAISGMTKTVTLPITATKTATGISGTMKTTLKRSDYSLKIPEIPFVANVSDTFDISGTFVATKVQ